MTWSKDLSDVSGEQVCRRFFSDRAVFVLAVVLGSWSSASGASATPGAGHQDLATSRHEVGVRTSEYRDFTLFIHGGWSDRARAADPIAAQPRLALPAREKALPSAGWTRSFAAARGRVIHLIRAAETRHGLPAGLLDALVATESAYSPFAVSRAGAVGLAQLMPGTAKSLGVANSFDVGANLDGGARYLRAMIDRFGSIALGLAAYNAGPGAVTRSRGIPRNGETPAYVDRVLARWRALTGL